MCDFSSGKRLRYTLESSLLIYFQYQKEHGDCRVFTKSDLGRWVAYQRCSRNNNLKVLTDQRIQLLDEIGFSWSAMPESWTPPPPGGEPRQNRAIVAKLMYPDLLIREVLLLGGFEEEELNSVKNPKHPWRTGEKVLPGNFFVTNSNF